MESLLQTLPGHPSLGAIILKMRRVVRFFQSGFLQLRAGSWHLRSPPELRGDVGSVGAAGVLANYEDGRETMGRRWFDLHSIS